MNELQFQIMNGHIRPLISVLNRMKLRGIVSRDRIRFVSLLQEQDEYTEKTRMELLMEVALKDPKGDPITDENPSSATGMSIRIDPKHRNRFQLEWGELMSTRFKLDITPEREQMFCNVGKALLEYDEELSDLQGEASAHAAACDVFEHVLEVLSKENE